MEHVAGTTFYWLDTVVWVIAGHRKQRLANWWTFSVQILVDTQYVLYLTCWSGTLYPTGGLSVASP